MRLWSGRGRHHRRRATARRLGRAGRALLLCLLVVLTGIASGAPASAAVPLFPATPALPQARPASWPPFLIGASYQGPAARAWRGDYWAWWADDLFDPALVEADFARANSAGLNTLRLFVQLDLMRDIRAEKWTKLDTVLDLADRYGLRLIVTLADWEEARIAQVARIDAAIAGRYAGRKTILAYDLKNEPTFWMIQAASYPGDKKPPLLSRRLLDRYGEQAANHFIVAFRASEEGQRGPLAIPERFSEDEAYVYHNNWILSYKLSLEATDWSKKTGRSDLEFFGAPEAARWKPFLEALDATYRAWLEPRVTAIRKADPAAALTIGHHDPLMAALPGNSVLDAISLHRYSPPTPDGLADQRRQLLVLRALYPDKPVLLGEFGHRATEIGDERAAIEESATWLQLLNEGFAGGLKWMLNDTRDGTDTMGMFRMDGSPRPVAHAAALISKLALAADPAATPTLTIAADESGGSCYRFARGDLLAVGGRCTASGAPIDLVDGMRQVFAARTADGSYVVGVTAPTRLLFRGPVTGGAARWTLMAEGAALVTLQPSGSSPVAIDLEPGRTYQLVPTT
ncbi:MAG: cellulase family glycosylhydrolase [Chloroflexi bacterium]|nr:cellulase family glycosylhydrolase [Chloroflexota bacterium]